MVYDTEKIMGLDPLGRYGSNIVKIVEYVNNDNANGYEVIVIFGTGAINNNGWWKYKAVDYQHAKEKYNMIVKAIKYNNYNEIFFQFWEKNLKPFDPVKMTGEQIRLYLQNKLKAIQNNIRLYSDKSLPDNKNYCDFYTAQENLLLDILVAIR